jgi:hypothetical protein
MPDVIKTPYSTHNAAWPVGSVPLTTQNGIKTARVKLNTAAESPRTNRSLARKSPILRGFSVRLD